ncbi:hypothetical protein ESA94_09425 [Lacibacter luteus]|uniref:Uncharacterized protein n=1 Tax=Lacibacter luteus TaxID=2508719 RepID=A0A4Q1CJY0_9BACT|nr:hypothetical protein [Lacibacter luteus]RXK60674.1 hypothetical protein ESA94_09425 [Lacibacter luteus]
MNHFISLQEAIEMTTLFRAQQENILKPEFQQRNILARSEAFERAAFDTLLAKNGCAGLRIYYGMGIDLKVHAIIVAIDANGHDLLPASASMLSTMEEGEDIAERGIRCPDLCPADSPLNS